MAAPFFHRLTVGKGFLPVCRQASIDPLSRNRNRGITNHEDTYPGRIRGPGHGRRCPGACTLVFHAAVMSKYILGSRGRVIDHSPAREQIAITLAAGGLVLLRVAMLLIALAFAWHYGLL